MRSLPLRSPLATLAAAALVTAVLAGCAGSDSPPAGEDAAAPETDAPAPAGNQACPQRLAQADPATHGFGTDEPAVEAPTLDPPERAWVCRYDAADDGASPDGDGTTYAWVRAGAVARVPAGRLPLLERPLGELVPADPNRMCTMELGPRWMLVYSHGSDLTAVVVDGYGCRDVRLTDDPATVVPGDATREGTVSGVLTAPGLLEAIRKAAGAR